VSHDRPGEGIRLEEEFLLGKRAAHVLFGFLMGGFTSFVISFVLTLVNNGTADFVSHWVKSWMVAFCLAVPIVIFISPLIRGVAGRITEAGMRTGARE
jgi:hypothetical protein